MKTYLNSEQFVDVFWQMLERRMGRDHTASVCDGIVWYLFQRYESDIKETLEGSMWGIEEYENEDNSASALIGHQFHKSFRQTDVIDDPCIDSVIWSCLQDAPVFWSCLERACKILVSEDAAELYRDEV